MLAIASVATPLCAQAGDVPVSVQIPLFLKVVSFDRQLSARIDSELVVGIAYQGNNRASVRAKNDAVKALARARNMPGIPPIRIEAIDIDEQPLIVELDRRNVTVLYVAPLRALDISIVADAARATRVTTCTGMPDYLSDGLAVSVRYQGERPRLLINIEAARMEGAEFSAELLKLAQVQ
jgi:hypothetical protein